MGEIPHHSSVLALFGGSSRLGDKLTAINRAAQQVPQSVPLATDAETRRSKRETGLTALS